MPILGNRGGVSSRGYGNLSYQQTLPNIVQTSLLLYLDAAISSSYSGSGATWYDLTGNGRHATLSNTSYISSGQSSYFSFNGSNSYAIGNIPTTALSSVTVQGWVNITTTSKGGTFFRMGDSCNGFSVGYGSSTTESAGTQLIGLYPCVRWIATSGNVSSGWQMITMIINESSIPSFYRNDSFVNSYSGTAYTSMTNSYALGRNYGDEPNGQAIRTLNGGISNFIIYGRALSQGEVSQNFNAFRSRYGV